MQQDIIKNTDKEKKDQEILEKVNTLLNFSWVLSDVIDGYLLKLDGYMQQLEVGAIYGKKRRLRAIRNQLEPIRKQIKKITVVPYEDWDTEKELQDFCNDSDFLSDYLLLLLDRCGEGKKAQIHIRSMLRKEPSRSGIYNKLTEEERKYEKMIRENRKSK